MENRAHALAAGLFILVLGAAVLFSLLWFSGSHAQRDVHVIVARTSVSGLSPKAVVKLRGVEVGSVESVAFDPADPRQILIRVAIDTAAPLTRGTYAKLGYQGVTGLAFIDLGDEGSDPRPRARVQEADMPIELRPSLLDQLTSDGPDLLSGLNEAVKRLNTLLAEPNQQRIAQALDATARVATQLADRAVELRPTLLGLPALVGHLDQTAVAAEPGLRSATGAAVSIGRLAEDLRARAVVLDSFAIAASGVNASVRSVEIGLVGPTGPSGTPLIEDIGQAARSIDRSAAQLGEQPQSILFGARPARAGPGESGFDAGSERLR